MPIPAVTLRSAGDTLAAIPPLVGFSPQRCIVVLPQYRARVTAAVHVGLGHPARTIAGSLVAAAPSWNADQVTVVLVDDRESPDLETAVVVATALTVAAAVTVRRLFVTPGIVDGAPWFDLLTSEHGRIPDPYTSETAATCVLAGTILRPDQPPA